MQSKTEKDEYSAFPLSLYRTPTKKARGVPPCGGAPIFDFYQSASAISRIRRSLFSQPRQASVMLFP